MGCYNRLSFQLALVTRDEGHDNNLGGLDPSVQALKGSRLHLDPCRVGTLKACLGAPWHPFVGDISAMLMDIWGMIGHTHTTILCQYGPRYQQYQQ